MRRMTPTMHRGSFKPAIMILLAAVAMAAATAGEIRQSVVGVAAGVGVDLPRLARQRAVRRLAIPLQIRLAPEIAAYKVASVPPKNGPLRIGHRREIPTWLQRDLTSSLVWEQDESGGATARFSVSSPAAGALRVALSVDGPDGVELRFFGFGRRLEVFRAGGLRELRRARLTAAIGDRDGGFWSPVIEGDTVGVEVYSRAGIPAADSAFSIRLRSLSHLEESVQDLIAKGSLKIGQAGSCNIDTACEARDPPRLADAVARIAFTAGGDTFLCTGTLLNDRDPGTTIPYLITANHCIDSPQVAATVNSYWFFERASCGSAGLRPIQHLAGGSDLLATGSNTDFTLLQLREQVSGAFLAGWSENPVAPSSPMTGIHHPSGDVKKWSSGVAVGPSAYTSQVTDPRGSHLQVLWSRGTTEPGSSGSGLFNDRGQYVGNLHGGFASCNNPDAPDWYGRFDLSFPQVQRWLADVPVLLRSGQELRASVAVGQWREYRLRTTAADQRVAVTLEGGDAELYVRRGSRPTRELSDCQAKGDGGAERSCVMANSGSHTYYIGVLGRAAGNVDIRLVATLVKRTPMASSMGVYDAARARFVLYDSPGAGGINVVFGYGARSTSKRVLYGSIGVGGIDSVGIYEPATGAFHLRSRPARGAGSTALRFGPRGNKALPVMGDWDGDGVATVGAYRLAEGIFLLRNSNTRGRAEHRLRLGPRDPGALPIAGDWDGDGITTVGLYLPANGRFLLHDRHRSGIAPLRFRFGRRGGGLRPVAGDWNGDGIDSVGLYDPATGRVELKDINAPGPPDYSFQLGKGGTGLQPVVGNWGGP